MKYNAVLHLNKRFFKNEMNIRIKKICIIVLMYNYIKRIFFHYFFKWIPQLLHQ